MEVFKILFVAIIGVLLSVLLKQYRGEYQIFIGLACGIILFTFSFKYIEGIFSGLSSIVDKAGINRVYFELLLKAVGISYLCELGISICKDANESAIALKLEMAGKLLLLFMAFPIFMEVLNILSSLVS